jgi:IgA Peptidase M64
VTDRRTRLWLILFLVQVASTWVYSAYGAWPVDPFLVTGPAENRVNIAFLGDGYTKSDMGLFRDHTNVMVHHMFNESEEPFVRYANYFNAYRIEVMSNEAGADDPSAGIERDTALDATYGCANIQRLICINQSQAWDWIDEALQPLGVEADMRIASVNSKQYGGSGGAVAVFAGGDFASPEIALHELGHSFSGLADEYGGPGPYLAGEPPEVNVTTNIAGTKWSQWIGYDQPGIGLIGTYAGGRYHDSGIYRPSHSMRSAAKRSSKTFTATSIRSMDGRTTKCRSSTRANSK